MEKFKNQDNTKAHSFLNYLSNYENNFFKKD